MFHARYSTTLTDVWYLYLVYMYEMQGRLLHFYGRNLVLENMHSDSCARYVLFNQRTLDLLVICERSDRIRLIEPRIIRLHVISTVYVDRLEDTRTAMKFSRGKSLESTAPIRAT